MYLKTNQSKILTEKVRNESEKRPEIMSFQEQKKISISLFFPAYNEKKQIAKTLARAEKTMSKLNQEYELIVVNDGSKDKTGEIAEKLAKQNPRIRVVHHIQNQGYGQAVLSGILASQYEYVCLIDADLQFKISEITKLLQYIPEYDAVIGYRKKRKDPFMRLVNAFGWNVLNRMIFGLKVKDIDCAFKIIKREKVVNLPLQSKGAMISAEILIRLKRNNVTFKEVPVTHLPNKKASTTGAKPKVIYRAFKELFSLAQGDLGGNAFFEAIKFGIIGVANTGIDFTLYYLLTRGNIFFSDDKVFIKGLSFFAGSIFSFVLNRSWTFQKGNKATLREIVKFYAGILIGLFINVTVTYQLLNKTGFHDLFIVLLATGSTFLWNFIISKFWVFKKNSRPSQSLLETPTNILSQNTQQ